MADALLLLAQAMGMSGEPDPEPVIDEAHAIGRTLGDGPLLARAALLRFGRGVPKDPRRSLVDLAEPLELLPRDAPQHVDLLCAAAVIVGFAESGPAARRLLDAPTRTHEATRTVRSEAVCLAARAIVGAIDSAGPDDLRSWADRSYELAHSVDDPVLLTVAFHAVLRTAYLQGDLDVVDASLDALENHAEAAMIPFRHGPGTAVSRHERDRARRSRRSARPDRQGATGRHSAADPRDRRLDAEPRARRRPRARGAARVARADLRPRRARPHEPLAGARGPGRRRGRPAAAPRPPPRPSMR